MKQVNDIKIKTTDLVTEIRRIRLAITDFEKRYDCSSKQMFDNVVDGLNYETPDVVMWMTIYQALKQLEQKSRTNTMIKE